MSTFTCWPPWRIYALGRGVVFGGSQPVAANGQRPGVGRVSRAGASSIVCRLPTPKARGQPKGLADYGLEPSVPSRQIHEPLSRMRGRGQAIWVTSHSLGGALAILQAACLQRQENVNV